jgi:hypothetical protein
MKELERLVKTERAARLPDPDVERQWRRLEGAVKSGARAMPIPTAPLSLGLILLVGKALASGAAIGLVTASVWFYGELQGWFATPREVGSVQVERPPRGSAPARAPAPAAAASTETPESAPSRSPPMPTMQPRASAELPADGGGFSEEVELLRLAMRELDAGRPALAERWLGQHASRFPSGVFAGEREALRVVITCGKGRTPESRAAAERFLSAYPSSLQRDRIKRTCELPQSPTASFPDSSE